MSKLKITNIDNESGDHFKLLSAVGDKAIAQKIGNSLNSYVDVKLTSSQLDTLAATPVSLIAAPGSGKITIVNKVVGFLDFNSAAYAGSSEVLSIRYTDGSGAAICSFQEAGFLEATADKYEIPAIIDVLPVANAAIVATANADLTTGDSPIYLRIYYTVLDLADLGAAE